MPLSAFLLVFVSVFLHAGWNFLSKKTRPSLAFYSLASLTAAALWLPWLLVFRVDLAALPGRFWLLWALSVGAEFTYFSGLAGAYRRGDISLVYPLARALPVLLTALITSLFGLGAELSGMALFGMAVLFFGCLLMPLPSWRGIRLRDYRSRALFYILLAAAGTTAYTILDSSAIAIVIVDGGKGRLAGSIAYLALLESGIAVSMLAAILFRPRERAEFRRLFLKSAAPHLSGVFASLAYVLILLAMGLVSNVSYIQAFRQLSLPLGVLAGVFLLREKPGAPRIAGIALVLAGLLLVSLG